MMKIATLVALLALAYGVDSAAMSYDEFTEEPTPEIVNEERESAYPNAEPADNIPIDQYLQELREYMEEQAGNAEPPTDGTAELMQSVEGAADSAHVECQPYAELVYSGNTIALQPAYDKRNSLGCAGAVCGKAGCPGLTFYGDDWTRCWGEVFEIYRLGGAGQVLTGDVVGIHYPRQRGLWLGCASLPCRKANCPGIPNVNFGFQDAGRWHRCWGEVFRIYAFGKGVGVPITSHDNVVFHYLRANRYLQLAGPHTGLHPCPGPINPPPPDKYNGCWGEIYELVKREY